RDVERALALVDNDIAVLSSRASVNQIGEIRREAVSLFEDLARTSAKSNDLRDLALAHFYLAFAKTDEQKFQAALPIWQQALAEYQQIQKLDYNSLPSRRNVALTEKRIAGVYYALGNYADSIAEDRKAAAIDEARVAAEPQSPTARMDLSFDLVELGWCLHGSGNQQGAINALNRAIDLRRE